MSPEFLSMREQLVARGLLGSDLRLTEAGRAHCEALLTELREGEAANDPDGPRVFWQIDLRGHARRASRARRAA